MLDCKRPGRIAAKHFFGAGSRALALIALALVALAATLGTAPPVKAQGGSGNSSAVSAKAAAGNDNAELNRRVVQIEEQLLDIQVMIGTLQSLARPGRGARGNDVGGFSGVSGGSDAGGSARIQGLETQVQALTAQVERLSAQLRAVQQERAARANQAPSSPQGSAASALANSAGAIAGFGSTTVTQGTDGIGAFADAQATLTPPPKQQIARAGADPKQLYNTAQGYLLQGRYGAAQTAFTEFVELYPKDPLAGSAQYWLGETYYLRGKYNDAANAFLVGYQTYQRSSKAPDSLLKLAMALDKLGHREQACSSYAELSTRFPQASARVRNRAQAEQRRAGC